MSLQNFVKKVNALSQKQCERLNKAYDEGKSLFGATHVDMPAKLLEYYYAQGYSPQKTLHLIEEECEMEAYGEALVS